jgi:hypothetical protein
MDIVATAPVVTYAEGIRRGRVFLSALAEIDSETRRRLLHSIRALAREMEALHGLNDVDAIDYAVEIVAALVWHKAAAPERNAT